MIQIVVLVYVGPGGMEALKAHNAKAVPLIHQHGGQVVSASCPSDHRPGDPDEVHILQFPDMQAFEDYHKSPASLALADSRAQAIGDARIYITDQYMTYLD